MRVRSKPASSLLRVRRRSVGRRDVDHVGPGGAVAEPLTPRNRRQGGPSQDRALYTCSCGLAFDALVSTSVDCPHCGNTQAW
jgi:hypothetical protein